jgi:hypothetical protein
MTSAAERRRARIVELTVLGEDIPAIATEVKLSHRHVRRVLADPDVKAQVRELEGERLRAVARRAANLGASAVDTLKTIATGSKYPAPARVSAARAILDVMIKVGEMQALDERIAAIEAQFAADAERERQRWLRPQPTG